MYYKNVIYYYKIISKGCNILKIDNKELEQIFININKDKTQGIEELYRKYKKVVYSIAFSISKNKEDSEDVVQSIFTKIYQATMNIIPVGITMSARWGALTLRKTTRISTWLLLTASMRGTANMKTTRPRSRLQIPWRTWSITTWRRVTAGGPAPGP